MGEMDGRWPRPMRPLSLVAACAVTLSLVPLACEAPDPAGASAVDVGLLQVVDISLNTVNESYPERPPGAALNSFICQVWVDVTVVLPDQCTSFSAGAPLEFDGHTFRYEIRGSRRAGSARCGGSVVDVIGLCLPGLGAEPPPPALPPGHYVVIVNGFTGGFDIP